MDWVGSGCRKIDWVESGWFIFKLDLAGAGLGPSLDRCYAFLHNFFASLSINQIERKKQKK